MLTCLGPVRENDGTPEAHTRQDDYEDVTVAEEACGGRIQC